MPFCFSLSCYVIEVISAAQCYLFFLVHLIERCEHYPVQGDRGGWRRSALCCPCGALLIPTQRSCRKELDARANTDVLHHPSTESNGGVCQSRRIPASAWLCSASSWLRHWDVSHRRHVTAAAQREKGRHRRSPVCLVNTDREDLVMVTAAAAAGLFGFFLQKSQSKSQK